MCKIKNMIDIIARRRAIFPGQYAQTPLSTDEVEAILEAANWAPTHRRTEPWRFKVFYSEESRKRLAGFLEQKYRETAVKVSEIKARKTAEKPLLSGCVIAICMQRDANWLVPEWEEIAAVAMAVQNMWLTATSMGIGAYWSTPAIKDHFSELLVLEKGETCLGFFYMGRMESELPDGIRKTSVGEKSVWF